MNYGCKECGFGYEAYSYNRSTFFGDQAYSHNKFTFNDFICELVKKYKMFEMHYECFLPFLTVPVQISYSNSEFDMSVYLKGDDRLCISFKCYLQTHILTNVSYDKNFFDILNDDGKSFFLNYYKKEIEEMLKKYEFIIYGLNKQLNCATTHLNNAHEFFNLLKGE
jgi:hypothetical protein